ncbi:sulfotransferase family 2 domain-containing protein [Pseudodesulfovibrio sp.]|uniref:sulfotransferase family 2 domain-containing protein n=1 Tax=Pseudodesulfovibrio sp. TaxID=2035812 RepID=UPI00262ACD43|nr:sulfotransferase family 2 domain-containing protein [Pseudodesulfovibrio sp.]MDD3312409.1 sulfotransferase family 2 domain-containing protein [Pseudodesulfovibrio sp.]
MSRANASPDRLTVFYHIPKCAGITVVNFLRDNFGERFTHLNSHCDWLALARRNAAEPPSGPCAAGGHYAWGAENLYPGVRDVFYFTILREPLSRLVSEYRFQVMNYRPALSLEDYFDNHCRHNRMTHYLAEGDLELAKERLRERFSLVGILEDMDRFMGILAGRLGLGTGTYAAYNKSRNPDSTGVDEAFTARFARAEAKDLELYALARELYERTLREENIPAGTPPAMVTEVGGKSYVPSDSAIVEAIRSGDRRRAIALLEAEENKRELPFRMLVNLCDQEGDEEKTLRWSLEAGRAIERMRLEAYRRFEKYGRYREALDIVSEAVDDLVPLAVESPRDASVNRTLGPLLDHKARLHRLSGDTPGAIEAHRRSREIFPEKWRTTLHGVSLVEAVPLSALDPKARRLVLRFGPALLLESLIEGFRACGDASRPDILVQRGVAASLPAEELGEMHRIPNGPFAFDPADPVTARLAAAGWDEIILLKNFDDLATYGQQLRLARALGAERVLVYPMDNICLAPAERRVLPLSLSDAPQAKGGRR